MGGIGNRAKGGQKPSKEREGGFTAEVAGKPRGGWLHSGDNSKGLDLRWREETMEGEGCSWIYRKNQLRWRGVKETYSGIKKERTPIFGAQRPGRGRVPVLRAKSTFPGEGGVPGALLGEKVRNIISLPQKGGENHLSDV